MVLDREAVLADVFVTASFQQPRGSLALGLVPSPIDAKAVKLCNNSTQCQSIFSRWKRLRWCDAIRVGAIFLDRIRTAPSSSFDVAVPPTIVPCPCVNRISR